MKNLLSAVMLVVGLAACAGPPQTPAKAHPTPAPTAVAASPTTPPPSGPLFAVLEGNSPETGTQADTVAIVGLDGRAVAKARFTPRQPLSLGNTAVMLQSEAQVGRDGVYYADGTGVVRLLKRSGDAVVVATFAMTPVQHELWYAVNPDGSQLLAAVLTAPDLGPPEGGTPWPSLHGSFKFDLESATAGGATRILQHTEMPYGADPVTQDPCPVLPVGWTAAGPVAMVNAPLATQNEWWGGSLFTVDGSGRPAARVGGSTCTAAQVLLSGVVPCITPSSAGHAVEVRDAAGHVLWRPSVEAYSALALRLTPDATAIALGPTAETRDRKFALPNDFRAQGWLDARTVVGRTSGGNLSYIRLDSPSLVHDLGFKGDFVGLLPG